MYFQVKNTLKINRYHTQQHHFNKPEKKNLLPFTLCSKRNNCEFQSFL
jgi:hypothetical protein